MKQTIEQTVAAVKNAPGSMYTREDVISLLSKIEAPVAKSSQLTDFQIEDLSKRIVAQVTENAECLESDDVVDTGSAEFSLNYNEIQLDTVDIDTRAIARRVAEGIGDVIGEYFERLADEEKEEDILVEANN